MKNWLKGLLVAALPGMSAACHHPAPPPETPKVAPSAALAEHSKEFRKDLIKVTDGIYVAIGYGIANSILVDGTDGFIVVDTMESAEEAREVNGLFRKITGDKPLKAIVYTHNHPDHTFGAGGFVLPGEKPEIYAQEKVNEALDSLITEVRPVINRRSLRMYGFWLDGDALGNVGIGPFLALHENSTFAILRPTKTFRDSLEDTVAGVHFKLQYAPGETDDTLFMWIPERKTLLSGDNFYRAFPNLYTIRGTPYRNPRKWADSLEAIRAVRPEFLVPSHSRPLSGADTIYAALTDYRDAIRYTYDQSVRAMNQGQTPDEIASTIRLPAHLAQSPYLQEFYGKASWSARMIFGGTVGWFDGDPAHLQPLAPKAEAEHLAALAGGLGGLRKNLDDAVGKQDWQWVLELSDRVLLLAPDDATVKDARVKALTALGEAEANPNARHYYLMEAIELRDGRSIPDMVAKPTPGMLAQMPISAFFTGLSVNLDPEASADLNQRVVFEFPDAQETYTFIVRRGVSELQKGDDPGADLKVRVPSLVFKETLARLRNPALAMTKDFEMVKGNKLAFLAFMKLFQPPG